MSLIFLMLIKLKMKIYELQQGIVITNFLTAADGGSLLFNCLTKQHKEFDLLFTQYSILDYLKPEMLPGRIYFNEKIIDLKSKEEKIILKAIKKFTITQELKKMNIESYLKDTFKHLCVFFESEAAIEFKKKVDNSIEQ